MTEQERLKVLTDAQWEQLAPLIEACRPRGKTPPHDLRRTIEAIIWRHQNGAKWRSIPSELGPWWMAAQMFNRWSHLGVWERLLELAQQRGGVKLGMSFLDGTSIRPSPGHSTRLCLAEPLASLAHQKAAGAAKKGGLQNSATSVRRLAVHAAALAARPV
jgi:transposase